MAWKIPKLTNNIKQ